MDLQAEFNAAQDCVQAKHIAWLKSQGVGALGMYLEAGAFAFGISPIEILTDDSWAVTPGGREAMILYDEREDGVDDLFAFFPQNPGRLFRRSNALRFLGCEHLLWAIEYEEPVYLRATGLDWLRAGRTGVVIADWSEPYALQLALSGAVEIRADSEALGKKIETTLTRPYPCPPILVAG